MDTRRPARKLDSDGLWHYALRILAQRPNSSSEMRQKLSRRADSPASVKAVLEKLREYGMADDLKFSEAFASARLQNQGFGRTRVLRDLRAKRVPTAVAQTAIEKTFAGVDETQLARQFIERKYRGKNAAEFFSEPKQLASAYRRLRMAGFSSGASIAALKSYSKQAAELEDLPDQE
jgi:SOS response regulatory protein OraA/RecX